MKKSEGLLLESGLRVVQIYSKQLDARFVSTDTYCAEAQQPYNHGACGGFNHGACVASPSRPEVTQILHTFSGRHIGAKK